MESFRLPSFEYHRVRTILCVLFITKTYEKKTVKDWMLPFPPSSPLHQDCYIARWFLERFRPPLHIITDKRVNVSMTTLRIYNWGRQGISF